MKFNLSPRVQGEPSLLFRPLGVVWAQFWGGWLGLFRGSRVLTYTEEQGPPIKLFVRYLSIELEDGTMLWENPKLSATALRHRQKLRDRAAESLAKYRRL